MESPQSVIEVIREVLTIRSSKEYLCGKLLCDANYDYLVILANPTQLFPSLTLLHQIDLVSKDSALPPYEILVKTYSESPSVSSTPDRKSQKIVDEDRDAKIEDLLSFVSEIANSDVLVKDVHQKIANNIGSQNSPIDISLPYVKTKNKEPSDEAKIQPKTDVKTETNGICDHKNPNNISIVKK